MLGILQPLAIDIGSGFIKVAAMRGLVGKRILQLGMQALPPHAVVDGALMDPEIVEKELLNLVHSMGLKLKDNWTTLGVGGNSVVLKRIPLDIPAGKTDITDTLLNEAEQHLQIDLNDLYFDYHRLKNVEGRAYVLLVGAKRELVDQYVDLLKRVHLKIRIIESHPVSIANYFEYTYGAQQDLVVLTDIGANHTRITLIGNGDILYSREIPMGSQTYTESLAGIFSLSAEQAEREKCSAASADPKIQKQILNLNKQLSDEIKKTIDYFFNSGETTHAAWQINAHYLLGGGSLIYELANTLTEQLKFPTSLISTMQKFPNLNTDAKQLPSYALTLGMCLRSLV